MNTLQEWIDFLRSASGLPEHEEGDDFEDEDDHSDGSSDSEMYISHPWEEFMWAVWSRGARRFAKVVGLSGRVSYDGKIVSDRQITEDVRSFLDPEAAPANMEFFLAWHDGVRWNANVPFVVEEPPIGMTRTAGVRAVRALQNEDKVERREQLIEKARGSKVRGLNSFFERIENSLSDDAVKQLVKEAFDFGVRFGRADYIDQMSSVFSDLPLSGINEEWEWVIERARRDHGGDLLTPVQLLKYMGGISSKVDLTWTFTTTSMVIEQDEFAKRVKALNRKRKSQ